jgi:hypothetical protein
MHSLSSKEFVNSEAFGVKQLRTYKFNINEERYLFEKILMKLSGNAHNAKNGIPLFCFIFKMNRNKDIAT